MVLALYIAAGTLVAALIVISVATIHLFRLGFMRSDRKSERLEERERAIAGFLASVEFEDLHVTSDDGLTLYAKYIPAQSKSDRTIILLHGYRSSPEAEFGTLIEELHRSGCNLLIPDMRAHRKSEGRYITFGIMERLDCVRWVKEAEKSASKIMLYGISMGAATALMSADLLPGSVRGIIGDCGYTSPDDILRHVLRTEYHLPAFPLIYTVGAICRIFCGFSPKAAAATDSLRRSDLPVMLIHGENDLFVPTSMSYTNLEAARESSTRLQRGAAAELVIIPGAAHAESHRVAPDEYRAAQNRFISNVFSK